MRKVFKIVDVQCPQCLERFDYMAWASQLETLSDHPKTIPVRKVLQDFWKETDREILLRGDVPRGTNWEMHPLEPL
jgi:hypothetical protein